VKKLLSLKADFKSITGSGWKPGVAVPSAPAAQAAPAVQAAPAAKGDASAVNQQIIQQGDLVRKLKADKADKVSILIRA